MFLIREATTADVDAILQIAKQTWWPTYEPLLGKEQVAYMLAELYTADKITKQITEKQQTFLLLIEDNQPVAFAAYSARPEDAEIYKLHKLYCLPVTQGKGYGKILINAVADKVIAAGKHTLDLNVNRFNNAKNFYEKMGFTVILEENIPIGPYCMNDYVMRKEL
ncbi:GNAT family N-acetyltransferase [Mucilaginibacter phyllosphaerae]|uniref:GNAT family N-acetyltransferase n=1 Tax=Mucilaginibacter phyllosphaerae TaxID=1812349 RepID=A0A4Y8A840_9SPHI|nr:GNAT family N-acetyltransferase [Mucilaginibacter phyllosphaerae]MBB3971162.1 GNAT superfamily N-acetyltransferase [Mucilaginibacter phyllosphaerae]TEW63887.1 GNAT family N-acetyltransferase [Mucilaginibacter phyllosphaerae]GGH22839.1 N-acetyltransferase [Mucilaginibacter phyllosphaerae]